MSTCGDDHAQQHHHAGGPRLAAPHAERGASAHTACRIKPISSNGTAGRAASRARSRDVQAVSRQRDGNQEQRGGSILHALRSLSGIHPRLAAQRAAKALDGCGCGRSGIDEDGINRALDVGPRAAGSAGHAFEGTCGFALLSTSRRSNERAASLRIWRTCARASASSLRSALRKSRSISPMDFPCDGRRVESRRKWPAPRATSSSAPAGRARLLGTLRCCLGGHGLLLPRASIAARASWHWLQSSRIHLVSNDVRRTRLMRSLWRSRMRRGG